MRDVDGTVIQLSRWREATVYPATPAPLDPDSDQVTVTGWPFIVTLLLLLPPLGWLQLAHRREIDVPARLLIAVVALVTVVAAWQTAFDLLRP